jgi:peptidoglycan-associated lipoprotein
MSDSHPQRSAAHREKDSKMNLSTWRKGLAAVAVTLALSLAGCANNQDPTSDLTMGKGGPITPGTARDFSVNAGDLVYFSTDNTELSPEAQQTLANQARWLKQYSQHSITIEGHADERGTREYNIALGAKRAQAVREFLTRNGINPARIRTVSFGKERPVAVCNDISCWSQNRRAQTVLNGRQDARS